MFANCNSVSSSSHNQAQYVALPAQSLNPSTQRELTLHEYFNLSIDALPPGERQLAFGIMAATIVTNGAEAVAPDFMSRSCLQDPELTEAGFCELIANNINVDPNARAVDYGKAAALKRAHELYQSAKMETAGEVVQAINTLRSHPTERDGRVTQQDGVPSSHTHSINLWSDSVTLLDLGTCETSLALEEWLSHPEIMFMQRGIVDQLVRLGTITPDVSKPNSGVKWGIKAPYELCKSLVPFATPFAIERHGNDKEAVAKYILQQYYEVKRANYEVLINGINLARRQASCMLSTLFQKMSLSSPQSDTGNPNAQRFTGHGQPPVLPGATTATRRATEQNDTASLTAPAPAKKSKSDYQVASPPTAGVPDPHMRSSSQSTGVVVHGGYGAAAPLEMPQVIGMPSILLNPRVHADQTPVTEEELANIAEAIEPGDRMRLGTALGMEEIDISKIEYNYIHIGVKTVVLKILLEWRRRAVNPTRGDFVRQLATTAVFKDRLGDLERSLPKPWLDHFQGLVAIDQRMKSSSQSTGVVVHTASGHGATAKPAAPQTIDKPSILLNPRVHADKSLVTERELVDIAGGIASWNPTSLGIALGMKPATINQIESDYQYRGGVKRVVMQILLGWRSSVDRATRGDFVRQLATTAVFKDRLGDLERSLPKPWLDHFQGLVAIDQRMKSSSQSTGVVVHTASGHGATAKPAAPQTIDKPSILLNPRVHADQTPITDTELLCYIADKISPNDWKRLGVALGISENRLTQFESDNRKVAMAIHAMLVAWRSSVRCPMRGDFVRRALEAFKDRLVELEKIFPEGWMAHFQGLVAQEATLSVSVAASD